MRNNINTLTRKVLIEKSPEEFKTLVIFGFKERWYSRFIGNRFVVRHCMSEADMVGTNYFDYNNYYKVTEGKYKGCVIYNYDCYKVDALDLA